jgi:hemoglobin-like flavoprotein
VVQVSGGALTRTSSVASTIKIKSKLARKLRVDTIFGAGLCALLFFLQGISGEVDSNSREENEPKDREIVSNDIMTSPNPIERSFEIAAERCEDLTPLVYRRLFNEHPEAQTMFRTEGSELVKGSMLALTIDAILDYVGPRTGHFRLIECEVSSHDAYGTPRELFVAFFGIIAQTLRELAGADWSDEIDAAWRELLGEIEGLVAVQER